MDQTASTGRRGPRRAVLTTCVWLALCLAAGFSVQALLAWGLLLIGAGVPRVAAVNAATIAGPIDVPRVDLVGGSFHGPPVWSMDSRRGTGWTIDDVRGRARGPGGAGAWAQEVHARCGWPAEAFAGSAARLATDPSHPPPDTSAGWMTIDAEPTPPGSVLTAFPLRPLWRGVALNTAFWGALILVLAAPAVHVRRAVRRARTARRTARGQCPACGYPLAGAAACSECGRARPATPA